MNGNNVKMASDMLYRIENASYHHITFIGTGISKFGGQMNGCRSKLLLHKIYLLVRIF